MIWSAYEAATVEAAETWFSEFVDVWGGKCRAVIRLWRQAWEEFTAFLAQDVKIRKIIYTLNVSES